MNIINKEMTQDQRHILKSFTSWLFNDHDQDIQESVIEQFELEMDPGEQTIARPAGAIADRLLAIQLEIIKQHEERRAIKYELFIEMDELIDRLHMIPALNVTDPLSYKIMTNAKQWIESIKNNRKRN